MTHTAEFEPNHPLLSFETRTSICEDGPDFDMVFDDRLEGLWFIVSDHSDVQSSICFVFDHSEDPPLLHQLEHTAATVLSLEHSRFVCLDLFSATKESHRPFLFFILLEEFFDDAEIFSVVLYPVSLTIDCVEALFKKAFTAKTNRTRSFTDDQIVLSTKCTTVWHFLEVQRRENSVYVFSSLLFRFLVSVVDCSLHSLLHF